MTRATDRTLDFHPQWETQDHGNFVVNMVHRFNHKHTKTQKNLAGKARISMLVVRRSEAATKLWVWSTAFRLCYSAQAKACTPYFAKKNSFQAAKNFCLSSTVQHSRNQIVSVILCALCVFVVNLVFPNSPQRLR